VLLAAAGLVEEAARTLRAEAAQQDDASSAGTGAIGGRLTPAAIPGGCTPIGVDGAATEVSTLATLALFAQVAQKANSSVDKAINFAKWSFMSLRGIGGEAADVAWAKFLGTYDKLDGFPLKVAKAFKVSENAISKLGAAKGLIGRVAIPLTIVSGVTDVITGDGDKGWHGAATRIAGGVGAAGAVVLTLSMVGVAFPPAGLVIAGVAVLGYGLYSLGNMVYKNWDTISAGLSDAADWVSDAAGTVSEAVDAGLTKLNEGVAKVADGVWKSITQPLPLLPKFDIF
jgi:hypothetical protein